MCVPAADAVCAQAAAVYAQAAAVCVGCFLFSWRLDYTHPA